MIIHIHFGDYYNGDCNFDERERAVEKISEFLYGHSTTQSTTQGY